MHMKVSAGTDLTICLSSHTELLVLAVDTHEEFMIETDNMATSW